MIGEEGIKVKSPTLPKGREGWGTLRVFLASGRAGHPSHTFSAKGRRASKMALYLISYDISEKDAWEYDGLWRALGNMGAAKILYSEWVLTGDVNQALDIYNQLAPLIQQKDRLLVQELGKNAAWDKLMLTDATFYKWLEHARG
jgi:hypothetical protein